MEGKTEIRIFRRELFINDPDMAVNCPSREVREKKRWAIDADGREATFEDGAEGGLTKVPDDELYPYIVARDWTEPLDKEVK